MIHTGLFHDADELGAALAPQLAAPADAVVLLSLGLEPQSLVPVARAAHAPVLIADCYGILGRSAARGRNLELMEAGRGREYGGPGGDGGQGVVAVVFSSTDEAHIPSTERLPEGVAAHMIIAARGAGATDGASAAYYGGLAKATYRFDPQTAQLVSTPRICVSTRACLGLTSFTDAADPAAKELLGQLPAGRSVQAIALFPCFMRGKNMYGANDVEPDALSRRLPGVPIFGMFCHGELGPSRCAGFDPAGARCTQHSMTSILALHVA